MNKLITAVLLLFALPLYIALFVFEYRTALYFLVHGNA